MKAGIVVLVLALSAAAHGQNGNPVTVTTMNMKWYGLGGDPAGNAQAERRDPFLRKFFAEEVPRSSVMVFEEVVDVKRFTTQVLTPDLQCESYEHPNPIHQHVVVCARAPFRLMKEPDDTNFIVEEVAIDGERSRPAVSAIVVDARLRPLFRVVGVHLKSAPDFSTTRQKQMQSLAKYLAARQLRQLPTVITGDFNTYSAGETGQRKDDASLMLEILAQSRFPLALASQPQPFTFRSPRFRSKFDWMFVDPRIAVREDVTIQGPCNDDVGRPKAPKKWDPALYYARISDHCPVSYRVKVP